MFTEFLIILKDIILPIFVIMAIGFILQRKFELNIQTLARINIYFLVPGFIFVKLYSTRISASLFTNVFLFFIFYVVLLCLLAGLIAKLIGLKHWRTTVFVITAMFFNSGNYDVPVNDLVFKSYPFAMSIQVITLTLQNIFLFSYGIFSLQSVKVGKLQAALGYLKMPVLYAMLAGVLLNLFHVPILSFIWVPAKIGRASCR